MASEPDRTAALMSIHPRYADQIMDGTKRVEFRRCRFASDPQFVVIYATAPVSKVIGLFEVDGVEEAPPAELWNRYHAVAGIPAGAYNDYYRGAERGVAIRVGRVRSLLEPLELSAVIGNSPPPQSFRYLGRELFERIAEGASGLLRGNRVLAAGAE